MVNKKKKITIGIFNDSFYPMMDGVVSVVNNYATELSKYANVIVFVPETPNVDYDDSSFPYKVVRCKSIKMHIIDYSCPTPFLDKEFKKIVNNYKLDIVHIHSPFFIGKQGIKYGKKHNIPVVATMHSQFKQDLKRALKLNLLTNIFNGTIINTFNKCDECWAVNSEVARIYYEDYGYKELPKVMNNATEMKPVSDVKEVHKNINKLHNIKSNEKVFLFVGRITLLKNVLFIVKSLKIVKDKSNIKFKMLFVGNGQDEVILKDLIKELKMEDNIVLCGKVADRELLAKYFSRADLFLFPSLYDASSIVQIEAASQKTPTLFIEGAATSATVTNNRNGFIAKNDEEDYADKIIEIINNEELYKKVSEKTFKELYVTWEDKVKEAYNNYLQLINEKNSNN